MLKFQRNIFQDDSGQALVEYVILSLGTALVLLVFLTADIFSTLPGGIYKSIYLFLRGLIINAILPIP
ncbi:MAG: hypothetical protein ACD_79C01286G0001 [uncultured bacterium]|nr:MAG: hypothetical protein ACD_79C01286G0001 [uncultured bacterium]